MKRFYYLLLSLISLYPTVCMGEIKLPSILGNHMVLQQQSTVKLWGKSNQKQIKIQTSWDHQTYQAKTNPSGDWEIEIKTGSAGGPYTIKFNDGDVVELEDIYLGEVWFCSGQSNMEMPVKGFYGQPVFHSMETISNAQADTPIRLFTVNRNPVRQKQDDYHMSAWVTHTSEQVADFSAVAYFFGQQLYNTLRVPIGLIHSSWGGSNIQSWMSSESLQMYPEISQKHLQENGEIKSPNLAAAMLYNGMAYPFRKFKIKGVIWYQGESNRDKPQQYLSLFKTFVQDWRNLFQNEDLPFYYVQIAPFRYEKNDGISSALLREAQFLGQQQICNVKMAVTMDIGDEYCIHPAQKQKVGQRLAYLALNHTYGEKGIKGDSPSYKSQEIKENKIILSFDEVSLGLTSYNKPLTLFEITGEDGVYHPAQARIVNYNQVEVWNDSIKNPVAVRYAFKNYVIGELFGTNGSAVSSFRTDANF
ncbi:sialate O-acetylesterase [Barnesiella viscericola]|uniref:sialate O-acetylesterase n=1 Tax=Barnesiella viscericola TaxID=397865 RepID=UPI00320B8F06